MAHSILIFCPVLGTFGGTETHIIGIACSLAESGWDVRLLALRSCLNEEAVEKLRKSGVLFVSWPSWRFLYYLLRPSDVLYTNSQGNASPLVWLLKGYSHPGFHHIHTSASEAEQYYWPARFRRFVKTFPRFVACSNSTRQNLIDVGAKGMVSFLPYLTSVNKIAFESGPDQNRNKLSKVRFAFIGRVEKPKGIDLIIEAARSPICSGIEWHVYGDGEYLDVLRSSNVPSIFLHGAFSGAQALEHIHGEIDAIVLPSFHSEGMPLALLEGMSRGLPWIATDKGGTLELSRGNPDLIVFSAGDTEGFIKASVKLRERLQDNQVTHCLIHQIFADHFSCASVAEQWLYYINDMKHDNH